MKDRRNRRTFDDVADVVGSISVARHVFLDLDAGLELPPQDVALVQEEDHRGLG